MTPAATLTAAIAGERRALARSLSLFENGELTDSNLMAIIESRGETLDSTVLGITGAPGVGKSCLINRVVQSWSEQGHRVAVIAVDPTSPITGGALLGDRIRMSNADSEDNVFFRSIATRKHGGSVPSVVRGMLEILAACGWSRCIVETVGAGQGEIRVAAVADRIVLVEAPHRGDSVQAEKAGLIELADLIVINKSDLDGAKKTADEIRHALEAATIPTPPILLASATTGDGVEALMESIDSLKVSDFAARTRARESMRAAWDMCLLNSPNFEEQIDNIVAGNTTIDEALEKLRDD